MPKPPYFNHYFEHITDRRRCIWSTRWAPSIPSHIHYWKERPMYAHASDCHTHHSSTADYWPSWWCMVQVRYLRCCRTPPREPTVPHIAFNATLESFGLPLCTFFTTIPHMPIAQLYSSISGRPSNANHLPQMLPYYKWDTAVTWSSAFPQCQ